MYLTPDDDSISIPELGDRFTKNVTTNQIVFTLNEGDGNGKDDEVSISPTFYVQFLRTKISSSAFLYLYFRFVIFGVRLLALKVLIKCWLNGLQWSISPTFYVCIFANIIVPKNIIPKMLVQKSFIKKLLYKKAEHKLMVKLTPGGRS